MLYQVYREINCNVLKIKLNTKSKKLSVYNSFVKLLVELRSNR